MTIDPLWELWVLQTFIKSFKALLETDGVYNWPVYVLGVSPGEETNVDLSKPARLSIAVNTAKRQRSNPEIWLESTLTLILTTTVSDEDVYLHARKVGILESVIPRCLQVKSWTGAGNVIANMNLLSDVDPKPYPSLGTTARVAQTVYSLEYEGPVHATN